MRNRPFRPNSKPLLQPSFIPLSLFLLLMIFCGHGCIHLWRYESLDVLTKTLVDRYRLKDADLTQLQFFISEDLTLQADYSEWSKKIYEGEHTLHTNETKYQEVLHIRKNLPGKCIEIIPEHKIYAILPKVQYRNLNLNWEPMRLHINFDNEYLNYLVFTPDPKSGKFVMEYNQKNNNLVYGGLTYQCQEGCGERLLLFDEIHDSTKAVNERTLPGNSFEDNHFPWELIAAGLGLYLILSATKN